MYGDPGRTTVTQQADSSAPSCQTVTHITVNAFTVPTRFTEQNVARCRLVVIEASNVPVQKRIDR